MVRLAMALVMALAACAPAQEPAAVVDPALAEVLRDVPRHFLDDPLLHAAVSGNAGEVRLLAGERDAQGPGASVQAVLWVVAGSKGCSPSVVDALVEAGADPRAQDATGSSLLQFAAGSGAAGCYHRLLALGGDAASVNANGYGVVSEAYLSGNASLFDAVLDSTEVRNPTDLANALGLALRKDDLATCRRLLDAGADPGRGLASADSGESSASEVLARCTRPDPPKG